VPQGLDDLNPTSSRPLRAARPRGSTRYLVFSILEAKFLGCPRDYNPVTYLRFQKTRVKFLNLSEDLKFIMGHGFRSDQISGRNAEPGTFSVQFCRQIAQTGWFEGCLHLWGALLVDIGKKSTVRVEVVASCADRLVNESWSYSEWNRFCISQNITKFLG